MNEVEKQVIQQLRDAPIQTPGHIRHHIKADLSQGEMLTLLDEMVEDGKLEYGHGE